MNGDSLTKASSRLSMVCEATIYIKKHFKDKQKKQEIKRSFVGKNTNNLLEMDAVKELEKKRKKKFVLGQRPIMTRR